MMVHFKKLSVEHVLSDLVLSGNVLSELKKYQIMLDKTFLYMGHFTVIEPSKFQNKTMKSSNINALFCHTNTKMPENYNFQILVHCYPIIN